jgi:uncharacterized membrane protein YjfL (UPF0719 family)
MRLLTGYAISVGWTAAFLALAFVARFIFNWMSPFKLRTASERKDAAVGHVLRGLYFGLAIISLAAIQSTQSIVWALIDGAVGMLILLVFFKVYDWIDPRDFETELAGGNSMLGMELEGLFVVVAAVVVGAMNLLGS